MNGSMIIMEEEWCGYEGWKRNKGNERMNKGEESEGMMYGMGMKRK